MGDLKREWWTVSAYQDRNLRWAKSSPDLLVAKTMYRNTIAYSGETHFNRIFLQHVSVTRGQAPEMNIIEGWEPESAELSP